MHGENEPTPDPWPDLANCIVLAFLGLYDCLARRGSHSSKCGLPLGAHPTNAESGGRGTEMTRLPEWLRCRSRLNYGLRSAGQATDVTADGR